jgi:uncharacterized protein (DUF58 family)
MNNKIFFLLLVLLVLPFLSFSQKSVKVGPKIVFTKTVHNYGTLKAGANGKAVFAFTNTGNAPLLISSVSKSCGCISSDWPSQPILPGQQGEIVLVYDTNREGAFEKYATVACNAINESVVALKLKGKVVTKQK